ncbi:MAG: hypothetical protein K5686_13045 [Lachnospiraceae bacterium]|nr:hypothetical protein [Lachnospiraceae bacterium]
MIFLFPAGLAVTGLAVAFAYRRIDIFKLLTVSAGIYAALYISVCGLLFLTDTFSIGGALFGTLIAALIACMAFYAGAGGDRPKIGLDIARYLPMLLLMIIAFLTASAHRSGSYDTGQDEGLYQIRAMFYMNGYYDNEISFPEYDRVISKWEKMEYMRHLEGMDGLYLPGDFDDEEEAAEEAAAEGAEEEKEEEEGPLHGTLHGVNTFSALLALFGTLFGLRAISYVPVLAFCLTVAYVWMLSENLRLGRLYSFAAGLVIAASPLMIWCGMNTLNEIVIAVFISGLFVMITEERAPSAPLVAGVFLAGLCFLHMMITVMMPMLVILMLFNYLRSREKQYLVSTMILSAAYAAGFSMMWHTGREYIRFNFENVFTITKNAINEDNLQGVVIVASLAVIVVSALLMFVGKNSILIKSLKAASNAKYTGAICRVLIILLTAGNVVLYMIQIKPFMDWVDPAYLFIVGYIALSGFIFLPAAVIVCIIRGNELIKDRRLFGMVLCMYYMSALICGVMWVMVREYYYFARYMAPYLFLPVILAGYLFRRLPKALTALAAVLAVTVMIMQGNIVYRAQDKTCCSYETLEEIASCLGENDALIINEQGYSSPRVFALQLKGLSGADLFFMNQEDPQRQARQLKNNYRNVWVLSYDLGTIPKEENGWRFVYRGNAATSQYVCDEEKSIPYPNDVTLIDTPCALLIYEGK